MELKMKKDTSNWPIAVEHNLLCDPNNETHKEERGDAILEMMIDCYLENKKFLDYGCGEGHIVKQSLLQNPLFAIGFDIVKKGKLWDDNFLTDKLNIIVEKSPYDVILLYDVLDHCIDPISVLKQIKNMSKKDTRIFVRCHPWYGRTGGHLYQSENMAFAHLFSDCEELPQKIFNIKIYEHWFNQAGLFIKRKKEHPKIIEPFFEKYDKKLLNIEYVDYILVTNKKYK